MEFKTDYLDYSVREFYETFQHRLPKIVKITQGFHGDIIDDIFDINWVLRIHTISSQKRIVAKTRNHVYSVPLNYPNKMCVIKKSGRVGKEQTIKQVLQDYKLPVNVRFSSDQHLTVAGVNKSTNNFPVLTLVEEFDEIYMLSNSLMEGRIYLGVVPIPLYLSKLRLAEVTGITGQPTEVWTYFKYDLSTIVSESVEFDTTYGNKDIAIFNEIPFETEGSYSYLQPQKYTVLYDILNFETDDSSCSRGQRLKRVCDQFIGEKNSDIDSVRKGDVEKKQSQTTQRNKPLPPLPKSTNTTSTENINMAFEKKSPPIPPKPDVKSAKSEKEDFDCQQSNGHAKTTTKPMRRTVSGTAYRSCRTDKQTVCCSSTKAEETSIISKDYVTTKIDVQSLSIQELGYYLKELSLSKYIPVFENERVDGVILLDLDVDMFVNEFGLSKIEARRLWRFAQDGHVPK